MKETILSVGIDIGTSTTQLIFSKLTMKNQASSYAVPKNLNHGNYAVVVYVATAEEGIRVSEMLKIGSFSTSSTFSSTNMTSATHFSEGIPENRN